MGRVMGRVTRGATGGLMGAVPTWVRRDVRRRWPSLVVLAVLVALVVGSGAAALAGARRQASVVDRLRSDALGMDALIAANPQIHYPWTRFDQLPYVEGRWGLVEVAGARVASIHDGDWLTTTGDAAFGSTVDRFVVIEGRAYDPATPGELVVSPQFAKANHVHVGDTLDVRLPTVAQARRAWRRQESAEKITGPHTTWRVVGIVTNTWLGPPETSSPLGKAAVSPATLVADRAHLLGDATIEQATVGSIFRLADPATDIARLTADARRLSGSDDVDVWNIDERFYKPARDGNRFEALTLAAFGALALLAGLFLVGSSVARASAAEAIELRRGMAVGMTPGQVTVAASVATALACAAGTVLGLLAAYAGSRWLPIGDARLYEPRPGASFDAPVLLLTGAIVGAAFV
ncbi:MAG TPA: hypothetical protein VN088_19490, partial [Nocardioides sp.]|nr:hypothetical protein [Nocardioides sp.]